MQSISPRSTPTARRVRALVTALCGLLVFGACAGSRAAVQAQLDPATVQDGDTLTLTIVSDEAQSGARPDVAPLRKDFNVLGTSSSSETKIINGSRSDSTRWLVRLQPLHTGIIDIAPIAVGSERTSALKLNVTALSPLAAKRASQHVFLEVEAAAGKAVYVQQQIPYTVRLYYDDSVRSGDLAAPDPADAIVEQLGKEARYTAMHEGRRYNVIERHYAIAPERSGALVIPAASFRGTALPAQNRNSGLDQSDDLMARFLRNTPLANDPFFQGGFAAGMSFGAPTPLAARGQEVKLDVLPRPPGAHGNWLPAEQITLHDSWTDHPPQFRVGEPVTRTVTIDAKGLAAAQIPPLALAQPANARVYPESPDNQSRTDGKTIFGVSKQSVTYIPTAQGTLEVPPVELAWWNTRSNAPGRAALPAQEFKVEPGAAGVPSQAATAPPAGGAAPASPAPPASEPLSGHVPTRTTWLAVAAALLALIAPAVIVYRRSGRRGCGASRRQASDAPVAHKSTALRALRAACAGHDRQAARDALLNLARVEWPDDAPRSLGALAARLAAGAEEVRALDRSLYGSGASPWQGEALWRVGSHGLQPKRGDAPSEEDGLGALYL